MENIRKILGTEKIVILFLIDFIISRYGFLGGTEKQLIEKINRLDRRKFKPILICLQKRYHKHIWDEIDCEKRVMHIYSLKSLQNLYKLFQFLRLLKEKKVHVIEAVFFDSILIGVVIGRFARVKNIITCRRDMGFWYRNKLLKLFFYINKCTDRVLVNANAIKKNVIVNEKIRGSKVDVIHNGIDLTKIEKIKKADIFKEYPEIYEQDKIVGIVANFNRYVKRIDVFIRAIKLVISQYRNVKFIIIGEGKLKPELMDLANKLKVNDFLIWAGVKIDPLPYVKCFDVGVISSDSEGFCNAIIEYMAIGVPVVATNVGGNGELVKDGITGFLIPQGDQLAMANKILTLLNNEELAKKMGENGRTVVYNNHSWEKRIKDYEKYYCEIVRRNHRTG